MLSSSLVESRSSRLTATVCRPLWARCPPIAAPPLPLTRFAFPIARTIAPETVFARITAPCTSYRMLNLHKPRYAPSTRRRNWGKAPAYPLRRAPCARMPPPSRAWKTKSVFAASSPSLAAVPPGRTAFRSTVIGCLSAGGAMRVVCLLSARNARLDAKGL